jgi:hypothetical protein
MLHIHQKSIRNYALSDYPERAHPSHHTEKMRLQLRNSKCVYTLKIIKVVHKFINAGACSFPKTGGALEHCVSIDLHAGPARSQSVKAYIYRLREKGLQHLRPCLLILAVKSSSAAKDAMEKE